MADLNAEFDNLTDDQKLMLQMIRAVEAATTLIVPVMVTAVAEGRMPSVIRGAEAAAQTWGNLAGTLKAIADRD